MLKVTLGQINPTIGDIDGNLELMDRAADLAFREGSNVIVFPELSLTGYYPADLLEEESFRARIRDGIKRLQVLSRRIPDVHWVLGAPTERKAPGKPLHNSLLVLSNGRIRGVYHKQLLPTYDVFDERRHFEPGPDTTLVLRIGDAHVGFMICEDGWNDEGTDYALNPFERLAAADPDLVISINASPSNFGWREQRHGIFTRACLRHNLNLVFLNQIGGHDQLVYDGASFVIQSSSSASGHRGIIHELPAFSECLSTIRFDPVRREFCEPLTRRAEDLIPSEFYRRQCILGIRDYVRRCGFKQVVVASSGGIDSAVTLALCAEALGPQNVVGITMPSEYSSRGSVDDSVRLAQSLGIELLRHPIHSLVETYRAGFGEATQQQLAKLPLENLQARIRGTIVMEYSNQFGHLLLTTGNKSEISVGYCTLYGDTAGGLGPIGDLYKTEIFALSRHLNDSAGREVIPQSIIDKPPSAELAPGQLDTDSLPPYEVLDEILKVLIEGPRLARAERVSAESAVAHLRETAQGRDTIARVRKMISRSEYKRRQAAPIIRMRARAFGIGRQMPIAARY